MPVGSMLTTRVALAAVLSPLLASAACTNFQDPTTVVDLRVLGINTEPSEVILDVDLSDPTMPVVNPASNPPIAITPLIVNPAGGPVTVTLLGCPNNPFGAAPPGPGQGGGAFPSGGARTTVGSTRCDPNSPLTWPLATTPITTPLGEGWEVQPTVEQLKAAFQADIFPDQFGHFHGGFDLGLPFVFHLQIDTAGETLIALKRVMYWARPVDAAQLPNETPVMPGLSTFPARDEKTFEPIGPVMPFDAGTVIDVPAGGGLWIDPSPAIAEPYETAVIDATTNLAVPLSVPRETLRYAFYATAGTFAPARTSSELPPGFVATDRIHLESQYHAPREIPAERVRIWVVVRDDRGGESWIERALQITPAPASP